MLLWIVLAAMTGLAALILLWPLARARRDGAAAVADDASFYRAALSDIDRDAARGLIGEAEAVAARTEAARRLLRSESIATTAAAGDAVFRRRAASLLALAVAPAIALGVYGSMGSPHLADQPLAARKSADPAAIGIVEAVARVEAHLAKNPNDGAGYDVLAPVYFRLGRVDDAARAYAAALRLNGATPERLANLGEALVSQAGGVVTAEARSHFARAVADGGASPKAQYYLALAREQDGDRLGAVAALEQLVAAAPADAPWLATVRDKIASLRGAPAGGEAIAALPDAERKATIRTMVENLSERLAANGGDVDEWTRLVRSRMALGERDKAMQALQDARKALSADAQVALDQLSREFGL